MKKKSIVDEQTKKPVDCGHIWFDAIRLVNPTKETKLRIADSILRLLEEHYPRRIKITMNKS